MKKILSLFFVILVTCSIGASNVIVYTATRKLKTDGVFGLEPHKFNDTIISHTFKNGIGTITFSADVTSIGEMAFCFCESLKSITIPESVTSIEENAFFHCSSLKSVKVAPGNTRYDSRNNCNAIIETSSNTLVVGCYNTVIPNSVTSIGNSAFSGCSSLKSITIPESVTSIGRDAFLGCSSLKSITIPKSVMNIELEAFSYCKSLESIKVAPGNTRYDSRDNCNAIIETSSKILIVGCHNTVIPNSVTSIGNSAFSGCSSLKSITIPESVTSIGNSAFSGCSSMKSITISESVTSIGEYAFFRCSSLKSIICEAVIPPVCSDNLIYFKDSKTIIYVPLCSINAYRGNDPWNKFKKIRPLEK